MDDIVKAAMAKWPNVPDCRGWLGLDARGQWWMRDDQAQAAGRFSSGAPGAKGSLLTHENLVAFINRNYAVVDVPFKAGAKPEPHAGQWFFQNGPQKVFVELEATPFVWRLVPGVDASGQATGQLAVQAHTGQLARAQRCVVDEVGRVYLDTELGFGLVHSQDVLQAADAIEQGLWVPTQFAARELPERFGYVRSPQAVGAQASPAPTAPAP